MNVGLSSDMLTLNLSESTVITRDDVGQRPVMDVKFSTRRADAFIVNEHGATYKCDMETGLRSVYYAPDPDLLLKSHSVGVLLMLVSKILIVVTNSGG